MNPDYDRGWYNDKKENIPELTKKPDKHNPDQNLGLKKALPKELSSAFRGRYISWLLSWTIRQAD
jgi:hypothetical protein